MTALHTSMAAWNRRLNGSNEGVFGFASHDSEVT
jgi:hypothetical protein